MLVSVKLVPVTVATREKLVWFDSFRYTLYATTLVLLLAVQVTFTCVT